MTIPSAAELESIYLGARPNVFRIYDKIAQLQAEGRRVALNERWPRRLS